MLRTIDARRMGHNGRDRRLPGLNSATQRGTTGAGNLGHASGARTDMADPSEWRDTGAGAGVVVTGNDAHAAMIDVVIPAYNAAGFLRETLLRLAAQTMPPHRVIVVNDASNDGTVAVAEACAAALRDRIAIQVIANTGPRGPSAARNTGIRASASAFIALLDADDLVAPNHHETLVRLLRDSSDAVLSFGNSTVFDASATQVSDYLAVSGVLALPARQVAADCFTLDDGMFAAMLRNGVFGTSACLFRREAALAAGLFDEALWQSEDTDFFLRLSLVGRFVFSRTVVTHKRVHDGNLSHARNRLASSRGIARSLTKLAAGGARTASAVQQTALRAALREALVGYLYHASRAGFAEYWAAFHLARRTGQGALMANPKNLIRLATYAYN